LDRNTLESSQARYWSQAGICEGAMSIIPSIPGIMVFSASFGALAAQRGLPFLEVMLMSAFAYAGLAQFLAVEMWSPNITVLLALTILSTTFVVNLRLVFSSAALQPWLAGAPAWQVYPSLFLLTMSNWILTTRYKNDRGRDVGYLFGSGLMAWLVWIIATGAGHLSGSLISQPKQYAIDLIPPLFFIVLLAPTYKSPRKAVPWLLAGCSALLLQKCIDGHWYIVLGVLAGAVAGALIPDD